MKEPEMRLTTAQLDRAAGVLLGQACGDALGVPYEFRRRLELHQLAEMKGGGLGPYAPGEWSDDTQMALCIVQVAAEGVDLTSQGAEDLVAEAFLEWRAHGASDIGNQTSAVLNAAPRGEGYSVGQRMRATSLALHARTGYTAGNGALMRTSVVGVAALDDAEATSRVARRLAELTHADPLAGDSCVIWSLAVRRAVLDGTFDGVREALTAIPEERRGWWRDVLVKAEQEPPTSFAPNGYTVTALQAAWSAIFHTPVPADTPAAGSFACLHLQDALQTAVHVGDDTDTVAAIAGALLGARWGASAVPARWRRVVHGWPQMRARDLSRLGVLAARKGKSDAQGWPAAAHFDDHVPPRPGVPHPADAGVILGTAITLDHGCDGVVSLCRKGAEDVPEHGVSATDHLEIWLIDSPELPDNPNLDFVIDDAARAVKALRAEGHRVLLHCVNAHSRTPTVAARYGCLLGRTVDEAIEQVNSTLRSHPEPDAHRVGAPARRPSLRTRSGSNRMLVAQRPPTG
jgi:ADP-ribosyl-[dinitrogen reductase] hydrolase